MAHSTSVEPWSAEEPVAPSSLDLVRHFRELRRVALPALLVAVVCAGIVFGVRTLTPARWDATVPAIVATTGTNAAAGADSRANALLTAPYIALGADPKVLHDIVTSAQVSWSDGEAGSRISVSEGQTPGLVTVRVLGDSAGQASVVARQAVVTLDGAARSRAQEAVAAQTAKMQNEANAINNELQSLSVLDPKRAALQTQYQAALDQLKQVRGSASSRLAALSDPSVSSGPVSPKPVRDAAVGLLVVLILAAEIMLAVRGRRGNKVSPSWARRVSRRHGAGFVDCTSGGAEAGTAHVESLLLSRMRSGTDVLLLNATVAEVCAEGLSEAAHENVGESQRVGELFELSGDQAWWRSSALERAALSVVVGQQGTAECSGVEQLLALSAELGLPTLLVLLEHRSAASPTDVQRGEELPVGAAETGAEPVAEVGAEPDAEVGAELVAEVGAESDAESVTEPDAEVDAELVAEVGAEPDAEPVTEPVAEVDAELVAAVVAELGAELGAEPVAETGTESVTEPIAELVAEVGAESVAEPVTEVDAQLVAGPVAEVDAELGAESVAKNGAEVAAPEPSHELNPDAPSRIGGAGWQLVK